MQMQMWFCVHWTKLNPPTPFAENFAWFHLQCLRGHFSFRWLQAILSLPENLCIVSCWAMSHEGERESASEGAALGEEKRENRKFNIGLCFRNMKLFLLFKYETEIEIDSPSGGQWTTREEAERNTKKRVVRGTRKRTRKLCKKMQK